MERASLRCHGIPEVANQGREGAEVDVPPEHLGELQLESCDAEQAWGPSGLELDKQVDVAFGTQLAAKSRAEEPQPANPVRAAEVSKTLIVNRDSGCQLHMDKSRRSIHPVATVPSTPHRSPVP